MEELSNSRVLGKNALKESRGKREVSLKEMPSLIGGKGFWNGRLLTMGPFFKIKPQWNNWGEPGKSQIW